MFLLPNAVEHSTVAEWLLPVASFYMTDGVQSVG
jgi:hypothetical protein